MQGEPAFLPAHPAQQQQQHKATGEGLAPLNCQGGMQGQPVSIPAHQALIQQQQAAGVVTSSVADDVTRAACLAGTRPEREVAGENGRDGMLLRWIYNSSW